MPLQFLEQVFAALRRGGIVRSRRGASGGYALARPADEITVLDVVAALDGVPSPAECTQGLCDQRRRLRRLVGLDRGAAGARGRARRHDHRRPAARARTRCAGRADVPHLTPAEDGRRHEEGREHHRAHRAHAAGAPQPDLGRDRRRGARQARVVQPRRQRQGPHRPGDDRGGRARRAASPRARRTIIEPTSGNTGIALAMVAAARGYDMVLTMPDTMSVERRTLLKAYGARLVLTPGIGGHERRGRTAPSSSPPSGDDAFVPQQFENAANPEVHRLHDRRGDLGRHRRRGRRVRRRRGHRRHAHRRRSGAQGAPARRPRRRRRAGRLAGALRRPAGPHRIQGIGAGFVPKVLDTDVYDEIITVSADDAFAAARDSRAEEGVLVGISAGANVWAAGEVARREGMDGKVVVTVLCDTGERYLSTPLFADLPELEAREDQRARASALRLPARPQGGRRARPGRRCAPAPCWSSAPAASARRCCSTSPPPASGASASSTTTSSSSPTCSARSCSRPPTSDGRKAEVRGGAAARRSTPR